MEALEKKFEELYGIDLEWWRAGPSEVVSFLSYLRTSVSQKLTLIKESRDAL